MPQGVEGAPSRGRRRGLRAILLALALVLVVGGIAFAGLWEFSASPRFCSSCHIMTPYVQAWKASKHRDVACVQCHYPPGLRDTIWVKYQALTQVVKWATHTYSSKPFALVEDGSCLRSGCHDRRRLQGPVIFRREIKFDHQPHLDRDRLGRTLRCTSCHSQIVVDTHMQVTEAPCFICHFKGLKTSRSLSPVGGCTGCHEPPRGDIVVGGQRFDHAQLVKRGVACQSCHLSVVEGDGAAPRERCFGCHNEPQKLERHADPPLVHEVHVAGHNIECTRCHTQIDHRLPPRVAQAQASPPR